MFWPHKLEEVNVLLHVQVEDIKRQAMADSVTSESEPENEYMYVCHAEINDILNKNSEGVGGCTIVGVTVEEDGDQDTDQRIILRYGLHISLEVFELISNSTFMDWSGGHLGVIKGVMLNNTELRKTGGYVHRSILQHMRFHRKNRQFVPAERINVRFKLDAKNHREPRKILDKANGDMSELKTMLVNVVERESRSHALTSWGIRAWA